MSNYMLYGTKIINNDNSLKDFVGSLIYNTYDQSVDGPDKLYEILMSAFVDDLSRVDIDYEKLLYKYRSEIGDVLYHASNNDCTIPSIDFFGEGAEVFFIFISLHYATIHYYDFFNDKNVLKE